MNEEVIIDIKDLSKSYPIYARPLDMLKELVFGGVRHDLFWALRDINLQVSAGERVGIVGPNGAGKSTLLQIIAGNLSPTSGSVEVHGSVSALLSLVPAWNLEQTGIENIRFNLLLRGCSPSEIAMLTEDIVDFAELGPFIHQPVKTYSSGMSARLSFAIATAISPEILIVDEVLGAGDGYFAGKAYRRMKAMCDKGKALLFVSHSTAAVRQMCDTAIWLESGGIRLKGPVEYVTAKYDEDMARNDDESVRAGNIQRTEQNIHLTSPDDILSPESVRIRLRSFSDASHGGIHYIRDIQLHWKDDSHQSSLSISLDAIDHKQEIYLDVMGCEWGRLYSRNGIVSRMLVSKTGARKGGHILMARPTEFSSRAWPIEIEWISYCEDSKTQLALEYVDMKTAEWRTFEIVSREELPGGWTKFSAAGSIPPADDEAQEKALAIANERRISPIQISDVRILTKEGETNSIREQEPFEVQVDVECEKDAPVFSMCMQINRSDGVYMFWQPSDFHRSHDTLDAKLVTIRFCFDDNFFSSADYEISATAITGPWHKDVVQSEIEVFDRKISAAKFVVKREFPTLGFGAINYRTRVQIEKTK